MLGNSCCTGYKNRLRLTADMVAHKIRLNKWLAHLGYRRLTFRGEGLFYEAAAEAPQRTRCASIGLRMSESGKTFIPNFPLPPSPRQ